MVSSIRTILLDFTITMPGLAEVTRISSDGIVAGGLSEALWLGRSAYRFSSESGFYVVDYFLKDTVVTPCISA